MLASQLWSTLLEIHDHSIQGKFRTLFSLYTNAQNADTFCAPKNQNPFPL